MISKIIIWVIMIYDCFFKLYSFVVVFVVCPSLEVGEICLACGTQQRGRVSVDGDCLCELLVHNH